LLNNTKADAQHGLPIVTEAYAPQFALSAMQNHKPNLMEELACDKTRWSVLEQDYKLIRVQDVRDELYRWDEDPTEQHALRLNGSKPASHSTTRHDAQAARLRQQLSAFLEIARQHGPTARAPRKADLEDELVRERLRGLGYIE
jgi:hypothetical protein